MYVKYSLDVGIDTSSLQCAGRLLANGVPLDRRDIVRHEEGVTLGEVTASEEALIGRER